MNEVVGRRRGAEIRSALVGAARAYFSRNAYDRVSVREIANSAGVQASLVNRYFGSKEGLFRAVLQSLAPEHPEGSLEGLGVYSDDKLKAPAYSALTPESLDLLSMVVHSVGSPVAHRIVAQDLEARFIDPLALKIQAEDRELRASLIFSVLIGLQLMRDLIQAKPLVESEPARALALITPLLEQLRKPPTT